jgi:hypothetical protein
VPTARSAGVGMRRSEECVNMSGDRIDEQSDEMK